MTKQMFSMLKLLHAFEMSLELRFDKLIVLVQ